MQEGYEGARVGVADQRRLSAGSKGYSPFNFRQDRQDASIGTPRS